MAVNHFKLAGHQPSFQTPIKQYNMYLKVTSESLDVIECLHLHLSQSGVPAMLMIYLLFTPSHGFTWKGKQRRSAVESESRLPWVQKGGKSRG